MAFDDNTYTTVLKGNTHYVAALACTPDGATLASGSADYAVRLWRLADNTCTTILKGHTNYVVALACTPDGATLASGSTDNTVRLWRLTDNTCTAVLKGHTSFVAALACMPDGATLASGSHDNTVRLWRLADNTCTVVLKGHTSYVNALACTSDGAILASGSHDNTVCLWRLADNTCTAVLNGHTNWVVALACTPDGASLASGSADYTVRLWRLADNTCTAVLMGHTRDVNALACTPDGSTLASGSADNTVRLWRLADNTCTAVLKGHSHYVFALACTPDGTTLASGSLDKTIRLWRRPLLSALACDIKSLASLSAEYLGGSDLLHQLITASPSRHECLPLLLGKAPASALVKDKSGRIPLHVAITEGDLGAATLLLQRAPDCALVKDNSGKVAMHVAIQMSSRDTVALLLHQAPACVLIEDNSGRLPLDLAIEEENLDAVALLLRHAPACALVKDDNAHLALDLVIKANDLDAATFLLQRAPDCALVKGEDGRVAMHVAVEMRALDAVALLLRQAPTSVFIKDDYGRLPLDLAIENKYLDAVRLLRRATDEQRLLALGSRPLDALKLFLCGDSRAGKTTLARTLRNARRDPHLDRTAGIDVKRATFAMRGGASITLSLHDFAGHHQFHAMHELILAEPNAVFAVLVDASRPAHEQRRHLLYWLRLIATRVSQAQRLTAQTGTRPTVVVLGTHADYPAVEAAVLRSALGDTLASSLGWSAFLDIRAEDLALVSCLSKKAAVDALQLPLERAWKAMSGGNFKAPTILDKLGPTLARLGNRQPLWMLSDLAQALTHVKVKKSFGRRDAKASAAVHAMQGDVLAATLRFLHAEGSVVWFDQDERLVPYVVLQPSWLYHEVVGPALAPPTEEFVGRSLHLHADSAGVVTASFFTAYYQGHGINPDFCLAVMQALALYYESAEATRQPRRFVFPAVLDEAMPAGAWPARSDLHSAARRIVLAQPELNILPPGLLPKLQVKLAATGDAMLGAGKLTIWRNALVWKSQAVHLLVQLRDDVLREGIDTSIMDVVVRFVECAREAGRRALSLVMDFTRDHCEELDTKELILSSAWLRNGRTLADAPELPMDRAEGGDKPLLFESGSYETAASLLLGPAIITPSPTISAALPIFISLRFAEAQSEARALQVALRNRGVEAFVCDELPGCELQQTVIDALYGCRLVVILGTQTYGRKTASTFSTYEELRAIIDKKIPFFLVKMCNEFVENIAQFHLPSTIAYHAWHPKSMEERSVVPLELVDQIMARLGQAPGHK